MPDPRGPIGRRARERRGEGSLGGRREPDADKRVGAAVWVALRTFGPAEPATGAPSSCTGGGSLRLPAIGRMNAVRRGAGVRRGHHQGLR